MTALPFGLVLHPLRCDQLQSWYLQHLHHCPTCRRDAMHPDGHANSNTLWLHCVKEFYLPQLAQLAHVDATTAVRVLDALALIPLCAETLRRSAQKVRCGEKQVEPPPFLPPVSNGPDPLGLIPSPPSPHVFQEEESEPWFPLPPRKG